MKKTGRPAKNPGDPIQNVITAKISNEDKEKLDYCCKKLGITKGAVIRKGIDLAYSEAKKMK